MSPDDKRWPWLVYVTVFVPFIGQPLVVVVSSILYYRWRKRCAERGVSVEHRCLDRGRT
jgi:hypothetical protein